MKYENVLLEIEGKIATITLNRPEKLNAMNDVMLREFEAALDEVRRDPDSLVLVIRGAGRAFSVGQDLGGVGTDEVMPPHPRRKAYLSDMLVSAMQSNFRWRSIFEFHMYVVSESGTIGRLARA